MWLYEYGDNDVNVDGDGTSDCVGGVMVMLLILLMVLIMMWMMTVIMVWIKTVIVLVIELVVKW